MFFPASDAKKKAAVAASFSGKKKKQQLQAKRQRKREAEERQNQDDKLEEAIRESLARQHPGEEITLEAVELAKAEYYRNNGGGGGPDETRGRREKRRQRKNQQQQQNSSHASDTDNEGEGGDSGHHSRKNKHRASHHEDREDEEYMYDAHGHGVRSAFKKESAAELAARRRLNFLPLADRQFMDAKAGIPFGRWFVMPRRVGDATGAGKPEPSPEKNENTEEGDTQKPQEPQQPVRPLVSDDGIGSSLCFPFSVEIPTRGWTSTGGGVAGGAVDILPNETIVEAKATGEAAQGDHESPGSGDNEGSSVEEGKEEDASPHKKSHAARATSPGVERIEEARFRTYLQIAENYPLPQALTGLTASSCERNLDVWRQLWRTVEASDVNVLVTDARYPIVHAHLGVLTYLTRQEAKPCVLVLNKSDLVPRSVLECWQNFLPLYLASLGFVVMTAEDAAIYMRENPSATLRASGRAAPIVIRTFTADPSKDTAVGADAEANVGRRRNAKQRRAKMYEQLRAGHLNVTKAAHGEDDAESDGMLSEDETAYDPSVNFKGKEKAERNLQVDKREFNELKIVADMISDLLAVCRSLAPAGKGAPKTSAETVDDGSPDGAEGKKAKQKKAPQVVTPPVRKAKKKAKRKAKRGGGGGGGHSAGSSGGDNSDSSAQDEGTGDDEDVLDTREKDDEAFIHVGFLGYPNVGKSSLLNCIRGTKVVSVSPTPGHTKHLQTIPVPSEGVTLVDSPGLVSPAYGLPRPLEAVLGTHQIAQTRDPQSGIAFLASHLPLEKIYGLRRPEDADEDEEWSAFELCEAYAKKRGYFVKHGKGALDVHRAAIAMLQEAYQGRLTLYFAPPELNFLSSRHYTEKIQPHLLLPVFKHP